MHGESAGGSFFRTETSSTGALRIPCMKLFVRLAGWYSKGLIKGTPPLINHTPLPSDPLPGASNSIKTRPRILQDPLSSTPPGRRPSAAAQVGCRQSDLGASRPSFEPVSGCRWGTSEEGGYALLGGATINKSFGVALQDPADR